MASKKIVLTGGPGAGKTTAADLIRREIGNKILIVPEAATLIFKGGFPRYEEPEALKATQTTIYTLQKNLENVQAAAYPERTLLCDRGTLDSAAYWPGGHSEFFKSLDTTIENELSRYDSVIFFETSAVTKNNIIECGNPTRNEGWERAVELDKKLCEIWSEHPNFHFISHEKSFLDKLNKAVRLILSEIN